MADNNETNEDNENEAIALLPYIVRLSETLSECSPHGWQARRYLFATLFVRNANSKKDAFHVIDEFIDEWNNNTLGIFKLVPRLVDLFGETRDPDWNSVRSDILTFYDAFNKTEGPSSSTTVNRVPVSFKPLPAIYHSVRNSIREMNENKEERVTASKELHSELQKFASDNPTIQCPVSRRYVTLTNTADPDVVWTVKQEAFKLIFQRARELFLFQNEEAHFHHAAAIVDFCYDIAKRVIKPDSRKDEVAFEKQAQRLLTFQRLYVGMLEKSQKSMDMDGVVKFVSEKLVLSRKFRTVRNATSKDYQRSKKLLGEASFALPGLVNEKASLALTLYRLLHERRKAFDELARVTDRIKNQLRQLDGWETATGKIMVTLPASQENADQSEPAGEQEGGLNVDPAAEENDEEGGDESDAEEREESDDEEGEESDDEEGDESDEYEE